MKKSVYTEAARLGVYVATWSPGDGATRYRFFREGTRTREGEWVADYNQGDDIFTALGRGEALVWLRGFSKGKEGAKS